MKNNCPAQPRPRLLRTSQHPGTGSARPFRFFLLFVVTIFPTFAAETVTKTAAGIDLPKGWEAADLGPVRKPGVVRYDAAAKSFTVRSIGEGTEKRGTFGYTRVKEIGRASCRERV